MIKNEMLEFISPQTNQVYNFDLKRQTRMAFKEYMNPDSAYEREYFQVTVYNTSGKMLNFGFVDDITDIDSVQHCLMKVVDFIENPGPDISSPRD